MLSLVRWINAARGDRKVLFVGQNIEEFDLIIFLNELERSNIPLSDLGLSVVSYIDTLDLFRDKELWRDAGIAPPANSKLGTVYERVFDRNLEGAHSADGDVLATLALLKRLDPSLKYANAKMKYLCL